MSQEELPGATNQRLGYLLVFGAALLWGMIGVFSRRLLEAGVPALEIAFWRAALAGAAFALHAAFSRRLRLKRRSDAAAFLGFALVGVTLFYSALSLAIEAGGISLAFVLLYTAPAFVAVLAALLLGERLTPFKSLLVLLSLAGIVMVARSGGTGMTISFTSLAWGLTAGLSYASYYLFGKWVLKRYGPVTIYAYVMPLGALGLLPFVGFAAVKGATMAIWLDLALISLFSTYVAYRLYYTGLRQVEASRAVLVATIEPVVAAVLAAMIFGERLGSWGIVGGVMILAGAALASLPRRAANATQGGP